MCKKQRSEARQGKQGLTDELAELATLMGELHDPLLQLVLIISF